MNIMYLLFSFTVGGTERLIVNICNEMCRKHQHVFIYIVNNLVDDKLLDSLDKKISIHLQRRTAGSADKLSTMFKIAGYIKRNRINVIHSNSFDVPELLFLSKILNPRIRIIHTVHGMHQYQKLNKFRILYRNLICDTLIGVSDCVQNDMIKYGASKQKTIMIYNGIDPNKYANAKFKKVDSTLVRIGCIARIMPSIKGQNILITAMEMLISRGITDIRCTFAGGVPKNQEKEYQNMLNRIKRRNLEDKIEFIGNIDNVPEFLNSIDICIVPSLSEGFGLTLIEAMCMGTPCIASDTEGPKELIDKLNIGIKFKTGDPDNLADAIIRTIEEIDIQKEQAWKAKERIRNQFSIEQMCKDLMEAYSYTAYV